MTPQETSQCAAATVSNLAPLVVACTALITALTTLLHLFVPSAPPKEKK